MKTTFLNYAGTIALIFFLIIGASGKSFAQENNYENVYMYFYVSGVWTDNKTSFISYPIYYSTFEECGNKLEFERKAKEAFNNYLKANYNDIFKYGSSHTQLLEYQRFSSSSYLKSKQQASDRLNTWKTEQLDDNYKITETIFTYSCE